MNSRILFIAFLIGTLTVAATSAETPPPDAGWRPHRLERCEVHPPVRAAARACMEEALGLFHDQAGGDAAVVLEDGLSRTGNPWLNLFLVQIYVLAGQGEPHCQPSTGPVAPRGDWPRDRQRLLDRAWALLDRLEATWPDDAIVDFLRADVARAGDDPGAAAEADFRGRGKCSHMECFDLLRGLRGLGRRAAKVLEPIEPEYPEECVRRGIQGEVVLDLLIDPQGRVSEVAVVGRADRTLADAARNAAIDGGYQAAQVGYYPVWSWLRVPVRFTLEN